MNNFNFDDFTMDVELKDILVGEDSTLKQMPSEKEECSNNTSFNFDDIDVEDTLPNTEVNLDSKNSVFGEVEDVVEVVDNIPDAITMGRDRYLNAIHAFTEYMPINLSIDRYIGSEFNSLTSVDNEPIIVIEKLQSNMICMIHNLRKKPVPAILNESRQPVIKLEGSLRDYVQMLEEEVTLIHGLDSEEFINMKKIIILENMNEKIDLNQNEVYITRQEALESLLNKYESVIDLTSDNCSVNFKEDGKKYSLNIGGLGYNSCEGGSWPTVIREKIIFIRDREILLTGLAADNQIVEYLKEIHGFKIANDTNEKFNCLAKEI